MRAPMAITSWVMDGTIEAVARALGLDPIVVRRRNMLAANELPYTMPTGEVLHDIAPARTLDAALDAFDVPAFRARQARTEAVWSIVAWEFAQWLNQPPMGRHSTRRLEFRDRDTRQPGEGGPIRRGGGGGRVDGIRSRV